MIWGYPNFGKSHVTKPFHPSLSIQKGHRNHHHFQEATFACPCRTCKQSPGSTFHTCSPGLWMISWGEDTVDGSENPVITRILVGSLQFFAWDFFHQQYHLGEIGCETKGSCCFFSFPTKNQKGTKLAGSKKSSDQEKNGCPRHRYRKNVPSFWRSYRSKSPYQRYLS